MVSHLLLCLILYFLTDLFPILAVLADRGAELLFLVWRVFLPDLDIFLKGCYYLGVVIMAMAWVLL